MNELMTTLFNRQAMDIFLAVAESKGTADIYMDKLKLTRKRFYKRMKTLKEVGLVTRNGGTAYKLTAFGTVINNIVEIIAEAENQRWKYVAVESAPDEETKEKMHDSLFDERIRRLENPWLLAK